MDTEDERGCGFGVEGDEDDLPVPGEGSSLAYAIGLATLGSLVPGGVLFGALLDHERRRLDRIAAAMVDDAVERTGTIRLLERIRDDEVVAALFRQAMDAGQDRRQGEASDARSTVVGGGAR